MGLTSKQKTYADIIIADEIARLTRTSRPSGGQVRTAKTAVSDEAFAYDKGQRGNERGYAKSWSTATANEVTKVIEGTMRGAVQAIHRQLKADASDFIPKGIGAVALASTFGIPAAANAFKAEAAPSMMTRRNVIVGLGAMFAGTALGTGQAFALNRSYIDSVAGSAQGYSRTKRRTIEEGLGTGIRGDASDYIPGLHQSKIQIG